MRRRWLFVLTGGLFAALAMALVPRRASQSNALPSGPAPRSPAADSPFGGRTGSDAGSDLPSLPPERAVVPRQRGISLGLFAEDVSFDYTPLLGEIAAEGATHVALVVPLYQEHGGSTRLGLHTRFSPTLFATAETIRAARRLGLEVMLFPIVRLLAPRRPDEWRGTLAPASLDAWFDSYAEQLGDLAALATMTGASRLAIGSELSSLDGDLPRWTKLVEKMRGLFSGTLVYSANWDHYREAKVLDLVDEAGVVAYFGLRAADGPSDVPALARRWRALRDDLVAWRAGNPQPFFFSEVGYRSRVGATASPWDEGLGGVADLDEQRRAFEAFRRAWTVTSGDGGPADPIPGFAGLYVWNWYGYGGPATIGYTPRGKPAAAEVKRLLQAL